ncbi:hypothetical protein BH10BAC3_BH10BAC3_12010 [soil metagenome]
MKHALALLFLILFWAAPTFSQLYQWTWMSGDTTPFSFTKNQPPPRIGHLLWVAKDDNLWLFGGFDITNNTLNDLWRYDMNKNEWMIIKGDSKPGKKSVYGVKDEPSAEAMPGGRVRCSGWVDTTGNLWLFGGQEIEYINPDQRGQKVIYKNDSWMFNVKLNQWAWMGGDTSETSNIPEKKFSALKNSTKEIASDLLPSGRCNSTLWTGNHGEIYIFGGYRGDTVLNDFWRYTPATKTYVLLSNVSTVLPGGVYGIKGQLSSNNKPGARQESGNWTDRDGNLWLYGGSYNNNLYQDMWKYDVRVNQWAWISGDSGAFNPVRILDDQNVLLKRSPILYGSRSIGSRDNTPGPRYGAVTFKDQAENFWLFAGFGSCSYNDVWKYDRKTDEWTWMKGDSSDFDAGNYGVRGIANEQNRPGDRYQLAGSIDRKGNFWMFGGEARSPNGYGYFNDLWKLSIQKEKQ